MMLGAATYVIGEGKSNLTVWGGELEQPSKCSTGYDIVLPRDALRMRVFVGPLGLWIELAAGAIERVRVVDAKVLVKIVAKALDRDAIPAEETIVWVENLSGGISKPVGLEEKRGGWVTALEGAQLCDPHRVNK